MANRTFDHRGNEGWNDSRKGWGKQQNSRHNRILAKKHIEDFNEDENVDFLFCERIEKTKKKKKKPEFKRPKNSIWGWMSAAESERKERRAQYYSETAIVRDETGKIVRRGDHSFYHKIMRRLF